MRVAKAIVAAVGVTVTALTAALADDALSFEETGSVLSTVVVGALSVYAVWRVPNRSDTVEPTER